jgi:hypothetical protein
VGLGAGQLVLLGAIPAVDNPADHHEHEDAHQDQRGKRWHAEPDENSGGQDPAVIRLRAGFGRGGFLS